MLTKVLGLIVAALVHGTVQNCRKSMRVSTNIVRGPAARAPQHVAEHEQRYWVKQGDEFVPEWRHKAAYVR